MTHWCRDIPRDEAVRAAEDGRSSPLPTLEEAIARAGQFTPPQAPQPPKCTERDNVTERRPVQPGGGGNVTGLRTERVTLEITGAPGWRVQVHGCDVESVRVVDECCLDRINMGEMILQRDAAIRERESLLEQLESVACRAATAENRVAELESAAKLAPPANADGGSNHAAPQAASGWLTAEERQALERAFDLLCDDDGDNPLAGTVQRLLARSSPPEVVLPIECDGPSYDSFVAGWNGYRDEALKALAAAGVTVKEVGE